MSDIRSWNQMAEWFDARQGDEGDLWHRDVIYPCVKRMAGDVAGLRVLDLACGNGSLTRWLKRNGADVVGADGTRELIDCARRREGEAPLGISYVHCDATRLDFATAQFDLVTCVMGLMDMPEAEPAISEIARVLRQDGRALICISHPCFDVPANAEWVAEMGEKYVWRKVRRYREVFSGVWSWARKEFYTRAYHRPLSWYFGALREAGLCVTALEEPAPPENVPLAGDEAYLAQIPLQCVLEVRRKWGPLR